MIDLIIRIMKDPIRGGKRPIEALFHAPYEHISLTPCERIATIPKVSETNMDDGNSIYRHLMSSHCNLSFPIPFVKVNHRHRQSPKSRLLCCRGLATSATAIQIRKKGKTFGSSLALVTSMCSKPPVWADGISTDFGMMGPTE